MLQVQQRAHVFPTGRPNGAEPKNQALHCTGGLSGSLARFKMKARGTNHTD